MALTGNGVLMDTNLFRMQHPNWPGLAQSQPQRSAAPVPEDDERCSCGRWPSDCPCPPAGEVTAAELEPAARPVSLAAVRPGDRITVTLGRRSEQWAVTGVTADGIEAMLRHLPEDENPHRARARARRNTTAYAIRSGLVRIRPGWDDGDETKAA